MGGRQIELAAGFVPGRSNNTRIIGIEGSQVYWVNEGYTMFKYAVDKLLTGMRLMGHGYLYYEYEYYRNRRLLHDCVKWYINIYYTSSITQG